MEHCNQPQHGPKYCAQTNRGYAPSLQYCCLPRAWRVRSLSTSFGVIASMGRPTRQGLEVRERGKYYKLPSIPHAADILFIVRRTTWRKCFEKHMGSQLRLPFWNVNRASRRDSSIIMSHHSSTRTMDITEALYSLSIIADMAFWIRWAERNSFSYQGMGRREPHI